MNRNPGTDTSPRVRVELRADDGTVQVLARLAAAGQHATLDPFVAWLLHQGRTGELLLVDDATGAVRARRRVGEDFPTHRRRLTGRARPRKGQDGHPG